MGTIFTKDDDDDDDYQHPAVHNHNRKRDFCESEANPVAERTNVSIPKKKKLRSTSQYIYETLFLNGQNSDITIVALDQQFKLHKLYLSQSSYFSGMFSGAWRESALQTIHLNIPDENIDIEALKIGLGSLYTDDVTISPEKVVSVLATAGLFALEPLEQQCLEIMEANISASTVCGYFEAANMYSQPKIVTQCREWLLRNLMISHSIDLLKEVRPDLMMNLILKAELFVVQVEMDVYSLLKKWLYLQLMPEFTGTYKEMSTASDSHWKRRVELCRTDFLTTDEGQPFAPIFDCLRLQHVINDYASSRIIEEDRIIPFTSVSPYFRQQWLQMLKVEQGQDMGPGDSVDEETFDKWCLRCGRILQREGSYCWRWTGYNYSVDLLVSLTSRMVIFKRNINAQLCPGGVSMSPVRKFQYRLTVYRLNNLGQVTYKKTTGLRRTQLCKDEEKVVLSIDRDVAFPIHISCQFLFFSPRDDFYVKSRLDIPSPASPSTVAAENSVDTPAVDEDEMVGAHPGPSSSTGGSRAVEEEAPRPSTSRDTPRVSGISEQSLYRTAPSSRSSSASDHTPRSVYIRPQPLISLRFRPLQARRPVFPPLAHVFPPASTSSGAAMEHPLFNVHEAPQPIPVLRTVANVHRVPPPEVNPEHPEQPEPEEPVPQDQAAPAEEDES